MPKDSDLRKNGNLYFLTSRFEIKFNCSSTCPKYVFCVGLKNLFFQAVYFYTRWHSQFGTQIYERELWVISQDTVSLLKRVLAQETERLGLTVDREFRVTSCNFLRCESFTVFMCVP